MKIQSQDRIDASLEQVFTLLRDELPKLVPYLPNIDRIEVKEQKQLPDGKVELVNHWYAKADIPSVAKKFVKPELLSWKDIAVWDDKARAVEYRLESFVANDLFSVKGRNSLEAGDGNSCTLRISCDVEIFPERLPGLPKFLASSVKGPVEELIKKMLTPNLTSLAKGLNDYFAAQKSR